uniref:Ion_trans domain-containing protein n=1 Tax=Hymenolepis diminuta TaxID=6216 RepID=A0A0R3SDS1_HYMDI
LATAHVRDIETHVWAGYDYSLSTSHRVVNAPTSRAMSLHFSLFIICIFINAWLPVQAHNLDFLCSLFPSQTAFGPNSQALLRLTMLANPRLSALSKKNVLNVHHIIMIVTTKLPNGVDYRIPVIIVPVIEMAILMTNALILLLSGAEMDDEAHFLKTTCRGPNGEEFFVFCSTLGSFLSYVINWD